MRDYNLAVKDMILDVPNADPLELQNSAVRLTKLLQICSGFYYHVATTDVCDTCYNLRKCVEDNVTPGSALCEKEVERGERQVQQYGTNPKLKALDDLLEDILSGGHKVIVWGNFMHEMDEIAALLEKRKIGYVRVDGTSTKYIEKLVKKFKEDPDTQVYLGQIKTGIAINLTNAKYAVYYSRTFSLEDWLQSLGRNFRIGQKEKVVVYSLCAKGTEEQQQLTALEQKEDISNTLTQRINCLACEHFDGCLEKGTQPWTAGCVFVTNVKRAVSKAGYVYPEFEGK
jgi:SNF2 family DNA or RNA helicase